MRRFSTLLTACLLVGTIAPFTASGAPLDVRETPVGTADAAVIETITPSPDGRRLAYAARAGAALLLTVDGKTASKPYDGFAAGGIVFSPDSKRVAAMVSTADGKWLLLVDGKVGKPFDVFAKDSLVFSADSAHVAVVAARGNKRLAVVDGVAGKEYDDVKGFAFGPVMAAARTRDAGDANDAPPDNPAPVRFAYAARVLANWTVVTEAGETGTSCSAIGDGPILFHPKGNGHVFTAAKDSLSFALPPKDVRVPQEGWYVEGHGEKGFHDEFPTRHLRFSPDGAKLAYAASDEDEWHVYVDGRGQTGDDGYEQIVPDSLAWRDNKSLAFAAKTPNGWTVIDGGKPGPLFEELAFPPVLSADRKHLAFVGVRGGQHIVVFDGREGPACDEVMEAPVFAPGGRLAYAARRGRQQFVVVDDKEGPVFDAVGRVTFSPDGTRVAYGAQRGNTAVVRIDDEETPAFSGFLPRSRLVFGDDGATLHAQTFRGPQLLQVTIRLGDPAADTPKPGPDK